MNTNNFLNGDGVASIMKERFVISDCLLKLGYRQLALDVQNVTKNERVNDYLTIITREAQSRQDQDVLDRLYFAGLIYG